MNNDYNDNHGNDDLSKTQILFYSRVLDIVAISCIVFISFVWMADGVPLWLAFINTLMVAYAVFECGVRKMLLKEIPTKDDNNNNHNGGE